jgi:3-dehydroquinate dehydratase-2
MIEQPKIMIVNGPNLNMLGAREPHIYGHETLADVEAMCNNRANHLGVTIDFRQSNFEGELVTMIQSARGGAAGIIINPAGYTHTSVAILDALKLTELPVIELHLSNPHTREDFRHRSFVSATARAIICGLGAHGYPLAVEAMAQIVKAG